MAPVEGIEPPLTVLETVALPLYYTGIIWWVLMVTLHEPDFLSLKVTVLQTADRGNTHNTLTLCVSRVTRECVLKSTTHLLAQFDCSAMLFNTLPFFYPHKDNPSGRPPFYWMFIVPSEVLVTSLHTVLLKTKNPRVSNPRVL